jgi:hypothetical protein
MKTLQKIPVPLFLFLLTLLAYALFFWEHGFYWDEAPWAWIYYRLGPEALTQYFSTNRPFWGMVYQATLPLLGPVPWAWQLAMMLMRWLSAVLVWLVLRKLWPQSSLPLWASALFLVYPGLGQNYISLMYTHFYIVFNAFLLSLYLGLLGLQKKSLPLHCAAALLSIFNLLTLEYFYFLEFLRLPLFWLATSGEKRARRAGLAFLPYLAVFAAVTAWRIFFFPHQNTNYTYQTLEDLRVNIFAGIGKLLWNMLQAFWTTVPAAWMRPFEPVDLSTLGLFTAIAAFSLAFAATLLTGLYFSRNSQPESRISNLELPTANYSFLLLGLLAWILGGGALWLVGERTLPQLHFSADRFTLPLMLGSSLIVAALLGLLRRWPRLQLVLLALLVGFSVGEHFQTNAVYRRDWDTQRAFFWQLSWRIPSLQAGTTVLTNDLPLTVFSDNSLSGPLNWIYNSTLITPSAALGGKTRDPGMNYILYFTSVRTQEGRALDSGLEPGIAFEQDYLATTFYGNTSQAVAVYFAPPGCLRVLDPEIDPLNRLIPPDLREAAYLSNPSLIRADNPASLPGFYQPEIPRNRCYYLSLAELARQRQDWQAVVELYEQSQSLGDHPNDPFENFVYIEGLAHQGKSQKALNLTRQAYRFSRGFMRPPLCALWERIERETTPGGERDAMIVEAREALECP